jgi:hypothetical protein
VRHWTKETNTFLYVAAKRYRPSMRRSIDHGALWSDARRLAAQDLEIDGHAVPPLPRECPFDVDALVSGAAEARALAAQLTASVAALKRGT